MIIDEKRKLIFIHIPKTAGTSIRIALKPRLSKLEKKLIKSPIKKDLSSAVSTKTKHETYSEFIENFYSRTGLEKSVLDDFTFFAFVRNPIDRFESLHRYLIKTHRVIYPNVPEDINTFVEDVIHQKYDYLKKIRSLKTQHSFIENIDNKRIIIGRYEKLLIDWEKISNQFGISSELEHLNKSSNNEAKGMNEQSKKLISNYFASDFEHFGY